MCSTSHHHGDDAGGSECVHMDWLIFAIEGRIKESIDMMDRRSFVRSLFLAGGAIATGAALLPRGAEAASLLDTLKDIEAKAPETLDPDLPAPGAQEAQVVIVRRRRRFRPRRRVCVTRIGRRGRIRRVCRFR